MSIIETMTIPEENNNTIITIPSPSGATTPSDAPTAPAMKNTTDSSLAQEMDWPCEPFEAEKKLSCMHAPKSAFMVDWRRTKSSQVWNNDVLIGCEKLKVVIEQAMSNDNDTERNI